MLSQTDAVKQAWAATDRTLDIIVTVDGKDYQATEINSLNYDAGAFTGDTLGIGSTYENSVTIEFSSVVEAFKQGLTVLPKVGILVNGKFEYTSLGTFIISEVNRDRNNNLTTIKALDQMCMLEGQYKPTVGDMASPLDIIADIANQGGVTVNTGELQHLPKLPNIKKIEGQTLRTAIGWVAQLYDGFATFDRDGKLTIRTTATPDCTITPSEYQQGGLTKNEVSYKTGGIKVTVNTKKTDDSGQEVDDTTMLQAGETTGSQIELTNDSMTSDLLTTVWTGIKDITYYPYTLNWFGNPNLEAGDWVTLTDTQGNQFNVPVNQYTMSFNGGLESTISATQSSSSAGGYAYTGSAGSIKNMIEALQVRNTASGNNVYPPSYQGQPNNPKKGDVWYKQNGNNIEVWIYQEENGTLAWVRTPLDGEVKAELQTLGEKTDEDLTRVKNELSSEAEGQWQSMKEATSTVASDLSTTKDSLATVKSDLSATKSSLNSGLDAVKSDLSATKSSLNTVASDLSTTKNNLDAVKSDLSATKSNLATVTSDLSTTKQSLADTKTSLATTASDLDEKVGQLNGSLKTANSKIEANSNAISEVKHTADAISTTVTDHSGKISQLQQTADRIKFSMAGQGVDLVDGLDGELVMGSGIPNTTWNGPNACLTLPTTPASVEVLPQNGTAFALYYKWEAGKTYTQSIIIETDAQIDTSVQPQWTWFTVEGGHNGQPAELINLGNHCYRLIGSYTPNSNDAKSWVRILDIWNFTLFVNVTTGTYLKFRSPHFFCADDNSLSELKITANSLTSSIADARGDISTLQQTASGLTSRVGSAEGNISQLQQDSKGLTSRVGSAEGNISQLQQTADRIKFSMAGQGVDLVDGLDGELVMGSGIPNTTWNGPNACLTLPTTPASVEVLPQNGTAFALYYKWEAGKTYTQSIIIETDAQIDTSVQPQWTWFTVEGGHNGQPAELINLGNHCYRLIGSYTPNSNDAKSWVRILDIWNFTLFVNVTTGTYLKFRSPHFFCADDNSLSELKITANSLTSSIADSKGQISSLQQTASKLQSDLTNAKGDISSVTQTANEVKTDLADAKGNISSLQQTAGKITTTLSNGGTNLLNNSQGNFQPANSVIDNFQGFRDTSIYMKQGQKYTLSALSGPNDFYFSGSHVTTEESQRILLWLVSLDGNINQIISSDTTDSSLGGTHFTWNYPSDTYYLRVNSYDKQNRGYAYHVQIEYGDTATPWKPSNGDISSLQQTASQLTVDMKDAKGNISSIQETAKELKATVGDDNTGLISSVKAIPGQISSAITASKQATVVTSAVDVHNMTTAGYYLLKGTLTNSPVDAWAFLRVITSAGGDRIYHQIWKDSASTVYTEEWTGSWSDWAMHINSDNLKSNVITAINQSTEGVSITGSKITLDGNVNITPGFTLSADYIKAGTLSADQISGGTLDLSKNITVKDLTANSISSGSISGQNLNINLDNGTVEFTKGNLHSTDGGFNISIDTKSFYLDTGNGSKLWIDSNGFHLQESASQHLWMNKDGLHNYTDTNGNGIQINDTTLKVLNSSNAGLIAKDGMLQFSANPVFNSDNVYSGTLDSQTYGTIGFNSNLLSSSLNGIFIKGREGVVIGTNSYNGGKLLAPADNFPIGAGAGINLPDGADKPASIFTNSALTLFAGTKYSDGVFNTPMSFISIGCNWYYTHEGTAMDLNGTGERGAQMYAKAKTISFDAADWINLRSIGGAGRIALDAQYVHSYPTYNQTTSAGANVFVAPDGALIRSSSARKYKTDIQDADNDYGAKLIEFTPQKWIDKAEKKRYEEDPDNNKKPGYYYGLIADDLAAAGLDMLVNYGAEGEVEGINYDRLAVALLPVIKSLKDQVASLKEQLKVLTK